MKENNCTQSMLANAINVRRQTISLYCRGESKPDFMQLADIAEYFNVTADYLVGLEDAQKREHSDISRRLGLNDNAIEKMEHGEVDFCDLFNRFLDNPAFEALVMYHNYISMLETGKTIFGLVEDEDKPTMEALTEYVSYSLSLLLSAIFEQSMFENIKALSPHCVHAIQELYDCKIKEFAKKTGAALRKTENAFRLYTDQNKPYVDRLDELSYGEDDENGE